MVTSLVKGLAQGFMTQIKAASMLDYIKALWPALVLLLSFATAFAVQAYRLDALQRGYESRGETLSLLRIDLAANKERMFAVEFRLSRIETALEEIKKELKKQ